VSTFGSLLPVRGHLAQVHMMIERGTPEQFKRSLIYGWGDTVRATLMRMNDRWLTVEYWACSRGLVAADMNCTLDRHHALLHIGTYVLRYGIPFDLVARVDCHPSGRRPSEKCMWTFTKTPARTGPSGESLPAIPAQAVRVRQMDFSGYRPDGRGIYRTTRGRAAHERARGCRL